MLCGCIQNTTVHIYGSLFLSRYAIFAQSLANFKATSTLGFCTRVKCGWRFVNTLRVVLLHKTEKKDYIILVQQLLEHDDYCDLVKTKTFNFGCFYTEMCLLYCPLVLGHHPLSDKLYAFICIYVNISRHICQTQKTITLIMVRSNEILNLFSHVFISLMHALDIFQIHAGSQKFRHPSSRS